jgi:hypothetical protein
VGAWMVDSWSVDSDFWIFLPTTNNQQLTTNNSQKQTLDRKFNPRLIFSFGFYLLQA